MVDLIDVVKDQVNNKDSDQVTQSPETYVTQSPETHVFCPLKDGTVFEEPEKEDPTVYVSSKTGRGPLNEEWIDEHWSVFM